MFLLLLTLCSISCFSVGKAEVAAPPVSCPAAIKSAGASENFGYSVAHCVHSITVEDLKLFEPTVTEKNSIPTVNRDLASYDAIIGYAPDIKMRESGFQTEAMQVLDHLLRNWNSQNEIQNPMLEKVVHDFHMREMWHMTLEQYNSLKKNGKLGDETCACILDVDNNGIMTALRQLALVIREPALAYKLAPPNVQRKARDEDKFFDGGFYPPGPPRSVEKAKETSPRLVDSTAWETIRRGLDAELYKNEIPHDFAIYLACALASKN